MKVGIIIASDTRSSGENVDETIPILLNFIKNLGWEVIETSIVPDNIDLLKEKIIFYADELKLDLVLVSGGTGPSHNDFTPEATRAVIEREMPGISEAMRIKNFEITKTAILSRGISGTRGDTLIINLPGNPQGAKDAFSVVAEVIPHCIEILQGKGGHRHGRTH